MLKRRGERMTIPRKKWILVTLSCLMLVALSPMNVTIPTEVQASPEYLFTINLVVAYEMGTPYWDIASSYKAELANLDINVELHYMDIGTYYDIVWDSGWNLSWSEGGWDMDEGEFWWMPTDLIWFEGCYSWKGHPPYGWNYFGWQNDKADGLLRDCVSTVEPGLRKEYSWLWQEEFMHDPPHASTFYRTMYEAMSEDLEGWNLVSWWYAGSELARTGKNLTDEVTVWFGSASDLRHFNPVFMVGEASEAACNQIFDMLMTTRVNQTTGAAIVVPSLASDYPEYSEDGKTVTVPLCDNVTWHDGYPFNATDVKFTFDAVLDYATGSTGYGDFSGVIDWVEVQDEFTVVFHLKEPCAYFNAMLANDFGGLIVPWHVLKDVPHRNWKTDSTNTEAPMVGTGPYVWGGRTVDEQWVVHANPDYFRGEPIVDHLYNVIITSPSAGWMSMLSHAIDFGDCWSATIDEIMAQNTTGTGLKVFEEKTPRVYFFAFNLHNRILSNRYVRQAIAHMIPYRHIIDDLVPTLGFGGTSATGPVTPLHGYLYNDELEPFEQNQTKAQQYLDMWLGLDPDDPNYIGYPTAVGDADFSGRVDLYDFGHWAANFGKTKNQWPWHSGDGVDPDFDNDRDVDLYDFEAWRLNWANRYPFKGAR